ncbi:hypothetical protein [Xanthomonas campestris]|uniref:hypothetical protein n=1 Tax=Xanthomonas campestris TaxID=339 RepID=UPI0023684CDA|nr:hypothetical protein [Xanthomonas campestris]
MTFRSHRPISISRAIAALCVCALAPTAGATTLLPPSISASSDRSIDTLMPPLLRTPATVSVAPAQRDALRTSLSASRAFPQVTRDFKDFLDAQAQLSYATRGAATKVSDPTAFAEMQRYLFNRYNGLTVLRSVQQDGKVFDCIPQSQQPALRDGSTPAAPPTISSNTGKMTPIDAGQRCDTGSVPLERIGLAEMSKHANLRSFLRGTTPVRDRTQAGGCRAGGAGGSTGNALLLQRLSGYRRHIGHRRRSRPQSVGARITLHQRETNHQSDMDRW